MTGDMDKLGDAADNIPSESKAMLQLIGRLNSCPEAKVTEHNTFLLI